MSTESAMDTTEIMGIIPHRHPFLLVDRILELDPGTKVVGQKNVTHSEPWFQGHFPEAPVMPGVLIVEAMAQTSAVLVFSGYPPEVRADKLIFFSGIDNVRFRRPVTPGDILHIEMEVIRLRGKFCKMRGVATVDGAVAAEAEIMASLVDKPKK